MIAWAGLNFSIGEAIGEGSAVAEGITVADGDSILVGLRVGILVGMFVGVPVNTVFLYSINLWLDSGWFDSITGAVFVLSVEPLDVPPPP